MEKVAIYLRKSREDDIKETLEETLARHERIAYDYCIKNDFKIVKIYKEVVSGETIENRPQIKKLLEDVLDKKYDGVFVIELERLSRGGVIDSNNIYECFKKSGTIIYDLKRKYDFRIKKDKEAFEINQDKKMYDLLMIYSKWEIDRIKSRLARGKYESAKEGYYISGRPPFGYTKDKVGRGYVLKPDKNAWIVGEIFNRYVNLGESNHQIREWLNKLEIDHPNFKIGSWENTRINQILRNIHYAGYVKIKLAKFNVDTYFLGRHEAIVDLDTFNQANQIIKTHHYPIPKKEPKIISPFRRLVRCPYCKRKMFIHSSTHIVCITPYCKEVSISKNDLEKVFFNKLYSLKEEYELIIKEYQDSYLIAAEKRRKLKEKYEKELDKCNKLISKCHELFELDIYDYMTYYGRKIELEDRKEELLSNIKDIDNYSNPSYLVATTYLPIINEIISKYKRLKLDSSKNQLLWKYIEEIRYYKTKRNCNINDINIDIKFK